MARAALYTVGGTVQAGSGLYIPRKADEELLELCREGAFAYVLAPRQLGKSSLMVRTAERLQEEDILSVSIDLTQLGVQVTAREWYLGLLTMIEDSLMLDTGVVSWWQEHAHLGNAQRLVMFFQDLVTVHLEQPLVIFVDEIDTTLSLDFTDDFYAALRSLYVARSRIPELKRLSFVLIGVASPGDLIRDPRRTPFNIGQRVEMTDFELEETLPLAEGLAAHPEDYRQVLGWIFSWTGGHPYLTQRLCRVLAEQEEEEELSESRVEQAVRETFLGHRSFQDNNLQFVRDMLTRRAASPEEVLAAYRQVRRGRQPVWDEEQSLIKSHLKLSGIVKVEGKVLKVRNRIYKSVFDERWIKAHLPINWAGRVRQAAGLIAVSFAITLVMTLLAVYALFQQAEAHKQEQNANGRAAEAVAARNTAEASRIEAERQNRIAQSRALAASSLAQLDKDPELGVLLAVEGVKLAKEPGTDSALPQASGALRESLEKARLNRPPLKGHQGAVTALAFRPDGRELVSGGDDESVIVWDTMTGKRLLTLKVGQAGVAGVTYSSDGQKILTAGQDGLFRVWDARTGRELLAVNGQTGRLTSAQFSPDGDLIATTGSDRMVRLWETSTGRLSKTLPAKEVELFQFTADKQLFVLVNKNYSTATDLITDRHIIDWAVYDAVTGEIVDSFGSDSNQEAEWNNIQGNITAFRLSSDGRFLLTAKSGSSTLWDVRTGRPVIRLSPKTSLYNASATFNSDGRYVATGGFYEVVTSSSTIIIWDTLSGKELTLLDSAEGHIRSLAFSPDGRYLASGSAGGTVRLWEALPGQAFLTFEAHTDAVNSAVFSPDGRHLLTAGSDNIALIWDIQSRRVLTTLKGHTDWVKSAAFSPDGSLVVTASRDSTAQVWDAKTGRMLSYLKGHLNTVNTASFSPDGRYIVTASVDGTARIWEALTGRELAILRGHQGEVRNASFSPDGHYVVTASLDGTARLWEVQSGKETLEFKGPPGGFFSAAFSPDGQFVSTAGRDTTVRLWNAATGQEVKVLNGHTDWVYSVNFSPDDRYLVTASRDGTARVWEVQSGKQVAELKGHDGPVLSASFSPDGNYIVTAGADKTALLHLFNPDEMLRVAQARLSRQLNDAERLEFGLETVPHTAP